MTTPPGTPLSLTDVIDHITAAVRDTTSSHDATISEEGEERFGSFIWEVDVAPTVSSTVFPHRYLLVSLTPQTTVSATDISEYTVGITAGAENGTSYIRANARTLKVNTASLDAGMGKLHHTLLLELTALARKGDRELMKERGPESYVVPRAFKGA